MKIYRFRFTPFTCIALLILVAFSYSESFADPVDDYIVKQMEIHRIPGLSLAVVENGAVVYSKGFGFANVELKVSATPETVYRIASVTKPFVATTVMLLVEDGRLSVDDTIGKHLTSVPEKWRPITIRQLLSHTSGIIDYLNEVNLSTKDGATPQDIISALGNLPIRFEPGTHASYSNTNYLLLGMLIEELTGMRYDAFLKKRVFDPLDMNDTQRNDFDKIIPRRSAGYFLKDNELQNSSRLEPDFWDTAAGGLISTVPDLVKWSLALDESKLLQESSLTEMWSPQFIPDDPSAWTWSLGWVVGNENGHRLVGHNGNREDGTAFIAKYPDDDLTVIVLTNLGNIDEVTVAITRNIAGFFNSELRPKD